MQQVKFKRYDAAEYLDTEDKIIAYLDAAIEDGDPAVIARAIGNIARAKNMSRLARETGVSREGLYVALSGDGNPSFATIYKVISALGLKLTVGPAKTAS